jgi:hypothetical protein
MMLALPPGEGQGEGGKTCSSGWVTFTPVLSQWEGGQKQGVLSPYPFLNAPSVSSCMRARHPAANVGPPPGTAAD